MSIKSNELLRTIQKNANNNDSNIRLATIKGNPSTGKYLVRFYGEDADSQKAYMKMTNASINASKPVLMQKVNGTYVIMGNVN